MSEFRKGWKPLAAALVGVGCGASPIPFNVLGTLFEPLQAEFGWNRGQVSAGITIFGITAALLAPVFGSMADRFGVRRVALWSLVAFALSFAALALTPTDWATARSDTASPPLALTCSNASADSASCRSPWW